MPSGKRASMREGPLAALFRKTAQDTEEHGRAAGAASRRRPSRESSATCRGAHRHQAPRPTPEVEEPRIPLPQERLRHAFSADIPENVLERAGASEPAASEPEHDVYARGHARRAA